MTNEYRLTQLSDAEAELAAARNRYDGATTKKARRLAAQDVEFWGNKAAFLANPGISVQPPEPTRTKTNSPKVEPDTHCQICARPIMAGTGFIAHHGYRRPGNGWQTASCFGARWQPYEVACDALPPAITRCLEFIAAQEIAIKGWLSEPPDVLTYKVGAWQGGKVLQFERPADFNTSEVPASYRGYSYEAVYWPHLSNLRRDLKHAQADLEFLQQRLANWKPVAA